MGRKTHRRRNRAEPTKGRRVLPGNEVEMATRAGLRESGATKWQKFTPPAAGFQTLETGIATREHKGRKILDIGRVVAAKRRRRRKRLQPLEKMRPKVPTIGNPAQLDSSSVDKSVNETDSL